LGSQASRFSLRRMIIKKGIKDIVSYVYQSGDLNMEYFSMARAQQGTQAHQAVQKDYKKEECEVHVEYAKTIGEDEFLMAGRMDLLLKSHEGWTVGEIKSTTRNLDHISEGDRPDHWAQAKFYAYILLKKFPDLSKINIRLIYCDLEGSLKRAFDQEFTLDVLEPFVQNTLEIYGAWFKILTLSQQKKMAASKALTFPFGAFRQYQRELSGTVYHCLDQKKRLLLRAPTGIGKTMGTIFPAIKALKHGEQKIFYLTAKTVGRTVAENAFDISLKKGWHGKITSLTAKAKMCFMEEVRCDPSYCPYAQGYFDRINGAVTDLFQSKNLFTMDTIREFAEKHKVCPFEYSLSMASISDSVIGDYNYLFDPKARLKRFFDEESDHLVLVDEAHNLYERACSMYTASLKKQSVMDLRLLFKGKSQRILKTLNSLNLKFIQFRHDMEDAGVDDVFKQSLDQGFLMQVQNSSQVIERYLADEELEPSLKNPLTEFYFELVQFLRIADYYDDAFKTQYAEVFGDLVITIHCLNPAPHLVADLKRIGAAVLFSATLHPMDYFKTLLLNNEPCEEMFLPSPFKRENLQLTVNYGISTKYQARKNSILPIIKHLYQMTQKEMGNYLFFFPSYQYMEEVYEAYRLLVDGEQEVMIQGRSMDDALRAAYLERFHAPRRVGLSAFAVLGGIFSEGIDLIGDSLVGAAIVGVGLPQINPLTQERRQYFQEAFGQGFDYAYTFPGFNKVMQAVGRVIRTESDKGRVLLIDSRYGTPEYMKLFPYEWQHAGFEV